MDLSGIIMCEFLNETLDAFPLTQFTPQTFFFFWPKLFVSAAFIILFCGGIFVNFCDC